MARILFLSAATLLTISAWPLAALAQSTPGADAPHSDNAALSNAIESAVAQDSALLAFTPSDAVNFCPAFASLDTTGREQFWSSLLAHVAQAESVGDANLTRWHTFDTAMHRPTFRRGLFQISIEAAHSQRYQCSVTSADALTQAGDNASCAVKILGHDAEAGGAIASAGRYWPSLAQPRRRETIEQDVSASPPCASADK